MESANSPGFVWRLQTPEGNATALRPFEDDRILVNMSLWASLPDLIAFVYKSRYRQVLQQRRQWFERFDGPYVALWWVPDGHIPSVEEAKERLTYLSAHGETPYAFTFKKPFPAPEETEDPALVIKKCQGTDLTPLPGIYLYEGP